MGKIMKQAIKSNVKLFNDKGNFIIDDKQVSNKSK